MGNTSFRTNLVPFVSFVRAILVVLCPVHLGVVCSWLELSAGVMAVPAGTSLASTQQLLNTVDGSKKRQACNVQEIGQKGPGHGHKYGLMIDAKV